MLNREKRGRIAAFLGFFGLTVLLNVLPLPRLLHVHQYSSYLYMGLIIAWALAGLLCLGILTNPLHQQLLRFDDPSAQSYTHGWLYYTVVIWDVALTVAMLSLLLYRCRISAAKKRWYVPALSMLLGAVLILVYFLRGGSPTVGEVRLYNLQEAFCFLYLVSFESTVQIAGGDCTVRQELTNTRVEFHTEFAAEGIDFRMYTWDILPGSSYENYKSGNCLETTLAGHNVKIYVGMAYGGLNSEALVELSENNYLRIYCGGNGFLDGADLVDGLSISERAREMTSEENLPATRELFRGFYEDFVSAMTIGG